MSPAAQDPAVAAQERAFLAHAAAAQEPQWLSRRRAMAMRRFVELGLPTREQEAWRLADLRPLVGSGGLPDSAPDSLADGVGLAAHRLPGVAHRVVLVNGRFSPELSQIGALPAGVLLGSFSDIVEQRPDLAEAAFDLSDTNGGQSFASLNAAFCTGGYVLALEPGAALERPVEVLHCSDAPGRCAHHMRSAILAAAGSHATVVETFVGRGAGWTNAVTTIEVGIGATLRHAKVQAESEAAVHLAVVRARLATRASYDTFVLVTGARLSREDIQVALEGEGATLVVNGAYLLRGEQEATVAPIVDHKQRGGRTSELLKGVIAGRAHGIFLGTVMVREGADDTDARQLNRNLMVSPNARVDSRPELTINADEVKCGHGATVGDLDEAALFYLISRGIDPATARHMLVEAFAAEVFDTAGLAADIDAHARRYVDAWLDHEVQRP